MVHGPSGKQEAGGGGGGVGYGVETTLDRMNTVICVSALQQAQEGLPVPHSLAGNKAPQGE